LKLKGKDKASRQKKQHGDLLIILLIF